MSLRTCIFVQFLKFLHLSLEVLVKRAVDGGAVGFLELVAVQLREQRSHIFQEFVDPCYLQKRLVYGLQSPKLAFGVQTPATTATERKAQPTTKINPRSFAAVHFTV
jgi:hypothetical protein